MNCIQYKGMVFFLGDWGMGDSDCSSCQIQQHVSNNHQIQLNQSSTIINSARTNDLLRPRSSSVVNSLENDEDEVALLPLTNQVCLTFLN